MADKNTADIGFEKQIWDAACVLRGNMDASEYKNVVLGLIFLKYISDRFDDKYQELLKKAMDSRRISMNILLRVSSLYRLVHVGMRSKKKHIRQRLVQLSMMPCVPSKKKISV